MMSNVNDDYELRIQATIGQHILIDISKRDYGLPLLKRVAPRLHTPSLKMIKFIFALLHESAIWVIIDFYR